MNELKTCNKCKEEKPISEFRKCTRNKDGLFRWCSVCQDIRNKFLYEKNREKRKKQVTEWNKQNKEKLNQYAATWRENNKKDNESQVKPNSDNLGENKM